MEYRILGPLEVLDNGRSVALGGAKPRSLLAILLLHANETVPAKRLIHELWDERPPETAANALQVYISQLRKVLGPDSLLRRAGGYELRLDGNFFDLARFEGLVAKAAGQKPAKVAAVLREALGLWRGAPLSDVGGERFARSESQRLEEVRLAVLADRIDADLALGRHAELVGELGRLVAAHPLRERLRAQLMLALYRSGRQADALAVYQRTRKELVEGLGIEPSPALQRLERRILQQDPELEVALPPAELDGEPMIPRLPVAARVDERRKVVTILFALIEVDPELDPELRHRVTRRAADAAVAVLENHGAAAEAVPGSRVLGVFGVPSVHEDDALRALRAAVELRETIERLSPELVPEASPRIATRMGIATGEILVERGRPLAAISGPAVEDAARLERTAQPEEILIARATERLIRGKALVERGGEAAARLLELTPDAPLLQRRHDTAMIGRERELDQLHEAFARAVRERCSYLFTVLGPAGIGKSRLAAELRAALPADVQVLAGHCLPYGEGITYWPVVEIVKQLVGEGGRDELATLLRDLDGAEVVADRIAAAIGQGESGAKPEETFSAVRKLLERLAREHPLVVFLDDLQWAEPSFLDLIEHVADLARDSPLLVVCLARPDLLDERPTWGGGKPNATSLSLGPLSAGESHALLASLSVDGLSPDDRARIADAAEGNPLFLEQMLAMVQEATGEPGDGNRPLVAPPTIHALLAARLDRLDWETRQVLERASVVGNEFSARAVEELAKGDVDDLDADLETLVRKELIHPYRSRFFGEEAYRFRHHLIRDVAYESLPKTARGDLHDRFARWLSSAAGPGAADYDEIVGYHLEEAYRYRLELAQSLETAADLGRAAFDRLGAAGRRAFARGDFPAALSLLRRALALLPPGEAEHQLLSVDFADALRATGDLAEAQSELTRVEAAAAAAGNEAAEANASVRLLRLEMQTRPRLSLRAVEHDCRQLIRKLGRLEDERGLAAAWDLLARVSWFRGRARATEEALREAIRYADRGGHPSVRNDALFLMSGVAYTGPRPVGDAIALCEWVLGQGGAIGHAAAAVYRALAGLHAMAGEFELSSEYIERDQAVMDDLGRSAVLGSARILYAEVEAFAGDYEAAEVEMAAACDHLEQIGDLASLSTAAALRGQLLYRRSRFDEARRWHAVAMETSFADDLQTQIPARGLGAKLAARDGDGPSARALAEQAAALAEGIDLPSYGGGAFRDLAEVLEVLGDPAGARAALQRALAIFEAKGNAVWAGAVQNDLSRLRAEAIVKNR
ncbi:MAG TPA: BTAD domain-containing putative transcriptional regulator [Gaiellaceae bacterium]